MVPTNHLNSYVFHFEITGSSLLVLINYVISDIFSETTGSSLLVPINNLISGVFHVGITGSSLLVPIYNLSSFFFSF